MPARARSSRSRPAGRRHRHRLELGAARRLRGADPQSPTPIFNEKVLAGLGREVQSTGLLAADAVEKALDGAAPLPRAVRPHRGAAALGASRPPPAATPRTARPSSPRPSASAAPRSRCSPASARRSCPRSAWCPASTARRHRRRPRRRLARTDRRPRPPGATPASRCRSAAWRCRTSRRNRSRRPRRSSRRRSATRELLKDGKGRTFYAIGGTWRALARLHMWQTGYPLHVMHGYVIPAKEALEFCRPRASGRSGDAVADRGGRRCAPAAARLCGAGARTPRADRAAEGGRDLRARRARGAALFDARRRGAQARTR